MSFVIIKYGVSLCPSRGPSDVPHTNGDRTAGRPARRKKQHFSQQQLHLNSGSIPTEDMAILSPNTAKFVEFCTAVVFFGFHVADIVTDIVACITYRQNGLDNFFKATLAFIIIPFVYIVYLGPKEVGGLSGMGFCESTFAATCSYFLGPLMPFVFKSRISDENLAKLDGFLTFGSGYMEDIPQVIIACFFLFSKANSDTPAGERTLGFIQLATSAASGIFKVFNGARKLGNGSVNCCGRVWHC